MAELLFAACIALPCGIIGTFYAVPWIVAWADALEVARELLELGRRWEAGQ